MAFSLSANGVSQSTGSVTFFGSWSGADVGSGGLPYIWFNWGYQSFSNDTTFTFYEGQSSGSHSDSVSVNKDRDAKYRTKGFDDDGEKQSSNFQFKTYADLATFAGLTPGTPTTTSCTVSGSVTPNTNESTGDVLIQYRVQGTTGWTETANIATGLSGSSSIALGGELSGLNPGTIYEARYKITRTTANDTLAFSNIGTFTTQSSAPIVISPLIMEGTGEMLAPSFGGITISAPLMEGEGQMFAPTIVSEGVTRVIEWKVRICDQTDVSVVMD